MRLTIPTGKRLAVPTGKRLTLRHSDLPPIIDGLLACVPIRKDAKVIYQGGGGVDAVSPTTETVDGDETFVDPATGLTVDAVVDQMSIGGFDYPSRDKGGLAQVASENVLLRSKEFNNAVWTAVGAKRVTPDTDIAPDGTVTADTLTDNSAVAYEGIQQEVAVADDSTTWAWSFHVKKDSNTARFPEFQCVLTGGAGGLKNLVQLNTLTGATNRRDSGGVVSEYVLDMGEYWRLVVTVVNNSSANTVARTIIYPALATTLGGATAAATGSIVIWGAQLENQPYATTFIETGAVSVVRARPVFRYSYTGNILAAAGTVIIAWTPIADNPAEDKVANRAELFSLANNFLQIYFQHPSTISGNIYDGAWKTSFKTSVAINFGELYVIAFTWDSSEIIVYVNGVAGTTVAAGAVSALADFVLGDLAAGGSEANGCLAYLLTYNDALIPADITTVSNWVSKRLGSS